MEKKITLKSEIIKTLKENDENFFYLAPDEIGSINNANLDYHKNVFHIDFDTKDGRNMKLSVPYKNYEKWEQDNCDSDLNTFLITYIEQSKEFKDGDEEMLGEIVDEYGDLMGDDDYPVNNPRLVGASNVGTDNAVKQRVSRTRRYYSDLGLGVVTWE